MPDRLPLVSFAWFANSCVEYFHRERSKTAPTQTVPAGVLRATTSRVQNL